MSDVDVAYEDAAVPVTGFAGSVIGGGVVIVKAGAVGAGSSA